jgi:Cu/Ag efflux pump CusA
LSHAAVHWAKGQFRWLVLVSASVAVGLSTGLFSLVALALAWGLFAVAVLVHELGHIVAYRALAPDDAPAIFVIRGMRCHVVRKRLTPASDIVVALAGPLAPGIIAVFLIPLLFAPLLWVDAVAPWAPLAFAAWLALAASHALCVALPFGDGATIREGWLLARAERSM